MYGRGLKSISRSPAASNKRQKWMQAQDLWGRVQQVQHQNQVKAAAEANCRHPSFTSCIRQGLGEWLGFWRSSWQILKDDWTIGGAALLTFGLIALVGCFVVQATSSNSIKREKEQAYFALEQASTLLRDTLQKAVYPNRAFQMFVEHHMLTNGTVSDVLGPNNTMIDSMLKTIHTNVPDRDATYVITAAPGGIVVSGYPVEHAAPVIGLNNLCDVRCTQYPGYSMSKYLERRADTLRTMSRAPDITLTGPYWLTNGLFAAITRMAIFLPYPHGTNASNVYNSTAFAGFNPQPQTPFPYECGSSCFNSTHYMWGISTTVFNWTMLIDRAHLQSLQDKGYRFKLTRPEVDPSTNLTYDYWLAGSNGTNSDPVVTYMRMFGVTWKLEAELKAGWAPAWRDPMYGVMAVVALLASALVLLTLKAKRQHYLLLRKMLPERVIHMLQRGRRAVLSESFSNVTILFADICSYPTLAATMPPSEVVHMLNDVYSLYDSLVLAEGAYKVETIGHGFMAVGGAPDACDDVEAAEKCARLALKMMQATCELERERNIVIRIGLHSGPVVAAVIGATMPRYAFFGDTVNTASRMDSSSLPGLIQISAATRALLDRSTAGEWDVEERGMIDVKGKGFMKTHFLHGFTADRCPYLRHPTTATTRSCCPLLRQQPPPSSSSQQAWSVHLGTRGLSARALRGEGDGASSPDSCLELGHQESGLSVDSSCSAAPPAAAAAAGGGGGEQLVVQTG